MPVKLCFRRSPGKIFTADTTAAGATKQRHIKREPELSFGELKWLAKGEIDPACRQLLPASGAQLTTAGQTMVLIAFKLAQNIFRYDVHIIPKRARLRHRQELWNCS
jgi:hypothetical protein